MKEDNEKKILEIEKKVNNVIEHSLEFTKENQLFVSNNIFDFEERLEILEKRIDEISETINKIILYL